MIEDKQKAFTPWLTNDVLMTVYEEWVAYPLEHMVVRMKEHNHMANLKGWFFSGHRGMGPSMDPLPSDLADRLARYEPHA